MSKSQPCYYSLTNGLAGCWQLMKQARAEHVTFSGRGDDGSTTRIGDFTLSQITPTGMRVGCHFIPFKFAQIAACAAGLEG